MAEKEDYYHEEYALLSPGERIREMEGIFNLIPRTESLADKVLGKDESSPEFQSSVLQELHADSQRYISRRRSEVKDIAMNRLSSLLHYSYFTSSGQRYISSYYGLLFDRGITKSTNLDIPACDMFMSYFGWRNKGNALFDPNIANEIERNSYRKVVRIRLLEMFKPNGGEEQNNRFRRMADRFDDFLRSSQAYSVGDWQKAKFSEEASANMKSFIEYERKMELTLNDLLKSWRQELIERDGIEP